MTTAASPQPSPISAVEPPHPGDSAQPESLYTPRAVGTDLGAAGAAIPAKAPAAPAAPDPAAPAAPEVPYEDPRLEKMWGGKYRTFQAAEDAAKGVEKEMKRLQTSTKTLEARLGQFKGPPLDAEGKPRPYEIKMPEGSPFVIDAASAEFEAVQEIFAKYGAPEAMLQELHDGFYFPIMAGNAGESKIVQMRGLIDYFGTAERAVGEIQEAGDWLVGKLGKENLPIVQQMLADKSVVIGVSVLRAALETPTLGGKGGQTTAPADTEDSILAMRKAAGTDPVTGDELWRKDPQLVARFTRWSEGEAARRKGARTG